MFFFFIGQLDSVPRFQNWVFQIYDTKAFKRLWHPGLPMQIPTVLLLHLRPHCPARSSAGLDSRVSGPHSLPKRHLDYLYESTNYGHNLPPSLPTRPTNCICRHSPQTPFLNPSRASVLAELWSLMGKVLPWEVALGIYGEDFGYPNDSGGMGYLVRGVCILQCERQTHTISHVPHNSEPAQWHSLWQEYTRLEWS